MKIKHVILFAWALLLIPVFNYGMIEESKKQGGIKNQEIKTAVQIAPYQIKNDIQEQIKKLINLLNDEYLDLAQQKNWLDWKDEKGEHQGALIALYNDIDPSKKKVLDDIGTYFRQKKLWDNMELAYTPLDELKKLPSTMIESKIKNYFEHIAKIGNVDKIIDKGWLYHITYKIILSRFDAFDNL